MFEAEDAHFVVLPYFVVVGRVGESERQHALFFQVGLVDTGKGFDHHGFYAEVTRLHGSVFAAAAFAEVFLAENDGTDAFFLVQPRRSGHFHVLAVF
jgi:hypothetical protein